MLVHVRDGRGLNYTHFPPYYGGRKLHSVHRNRMVFMAYHTHARLYRMRVGAFSRNRDTAFQKKKCIFLHLWR